MSLCLLCPGQGSQSPAMFQRLQAEPLISPHLERLGTHLSWDALAVASNEAQCFQNRHAQPLVVMYGLAVAAALHDAGIEAALVAGYSVGELTAHGVAGGLAEATVLQLAEARAAGMDRAAPEDYGMLAVRGVALDSLAQRVAQAGALIAIRNGPEHAVLAGPRTVLSELAAGLAQGGAHVVPLPVTVPAHTAWLTGAVEPFGAALAAAPWLAPRFPVLAGVNGQPVYSGGEAVTVLKRQLAEPVEWARTLDIAIEMGTSAFFELGPGRGLTRMVREQYPDTPSRALDEFASVGGALDWLHRFS